MQTAQKQILDSFNETVLVIENKGKEARGKVRRHIHVEIIVKVSTKLKPIIIIFHINNSMYQRKQWAISINSSS